MANDPISDMLARIRNAIGARHERTIVPTSRLKMRLAEILKQEGYVSDVRETETGDDGFKRFEIVLKYGRGQKSAIDGLRRISKPGRRVYVHHDSIPYVVSGLGVSILSTSSGVMTDGEARRRRVGGEILCEVW
ncbi:MAG: 30S ribosomal protein S8 [Deltaproteobacteria bacterium]|nr:30S ribosomal protein S8 [Deltaproteobacteria bacterium]